MAVTADGAAARWLRVAVWDVSRTDPRVIMRDGMQVGVMRTPDLAQAVVAALNERPIWVGV